MGPVLAVLAAGCGNGGAARPDARLENYRLVVLNPPGDDLGLPYNDGVTLRVRYEKGDGEVIEGAPVEFSLVASGDGENTAGSTLSTSRAITDAGGVAQVDLVAGAQEAGFRVRADAQDAPTAYFFINVSEGGFTRLFIAPAHEGFRDPAGFAAVQVRLYREGRLRCASFDIDDLPMSLSPPRSLPGFGGQVSYLNVSAGEPHSIVAWSEVTEDEPVPIGVGCVDLAGSQLPSSRVDVALVVRDRDLALDRVTVESTFDVTPVAQIVAQSPDEAPWRTLACGQGSGQLALDCTLDALAPDDALDCVATGSGPLADAIADRRGPPDASGCRPAVAGGDPSLDRLLAEAVALGARFPTGAALTEMLEVRGDTLRSFELTSELTGLSPTSAGHALVTVRILSGAAVYALDLAATSRPVIDQRPISLVVDGDQLTAGEHGFTLRYGQVVAAAFHDLGLAPAGLTGMTATLGTALLASVETDGGQTGCAALSAIVCGDIGQPAACVATACQQGRSALDVALTRWSQSLDGPGLDFQLAAGSGPARDTDHDLHIDRVGAGEGGDGDAEPGAWSARLILSDGTAVPITGSF